MRLLSTLVADSCGPMLSSGILSRSFCTSAVGTNDLLHAIESRSFCGIGVELHTKHGTRSGALSMRSRGAGFGRVLDESSCVCMLTRFDVKQLEMRRSKHRVCK